VIEVRDSQLEKAQSPMLVTNVGIRIETTESHPSNAKSGMEVIVLGVVMAD